ncbi:alpha/beta hydrolase family protein [Erythrobacter sp. NE805]|uniref:alpha/beta hydrolase family protein n=1 Tax=Erythrobacter sp. NE805 TaxID=3389875 RepID=UPI00396B45F6
MIPMLLALAAALPAAAQVPIPPAVISDPVPDKAHPAGTVAFSLPTNGEEVNAVMFTAAGAGAHPTVIVLHGWPGNERNLDIARSAQRAGWNALTFSYRGAWGSPGSWSFAHCIEDTEAALAHLRRPEVAKRFGIDPARIAVVGHSLGGWLAVRLAATDRRLIGAAAISAPDMGAFGIAAAKDRAAALPIAAGNTRALAGSTPDLAIDELAARGPGWTFATMLPGLEGQRLMVLGSDDPWRDVAAQLAKDAAAAGARVDYTHVDTDHAWSDRRILLQALVINWLESLHTR